MSGRHQPENGADSQAQKERLSPDAPAALAGSSLGRAADTDDSTVITGYVNPEERSTRTGYAAGRRAAEREGQILIAALVEQAGGEIRLAHKYLVSTTGDLTRSDDPDTGDIVYRAGPRR